MPSKHADDFMMMSVVFDERCAMKAKFEDRNAGYYEWPGVIIYSILLKTQKREEKVSAECASRNGSVSVVATVRISVIGGIVN